MARFFDRLNAFLSEGGPLAVVVEDLPETAHQTRDNTDFRVGCGKAKSVVILADPPLARRIGAPHERSAGGESDPYFLALVRHGGGVNGPP